MVSKIWNEKKDKPCPSTLKIEEKESYKWVENSEQTKKHLPKAKQLTFIGDRENDIYEFFCRIPDERCHVLVRSCRKRKLANGKSLRASLDACPWAANFNLKIPAQKDQPKRMAKMRIHWLNDVELAKSMNRSWLMKDYPPKVKLNVVEVLEDPSSVPEGEDPIHWVLYTTHPINNLEQALQIVQWYKQRWWIEDLFRVLKKKGLDVERSQLGTGLALQKLVLLCLEQALKILLMRQERLGKNNYPASLCFSQLELDFLQLTDLEFTQQSNSNRNPFNKNTLAWATWIIALLAEWVPADINKRPPGVITISDGLIVFSHRFMGWKTALKFFKDFSNKSP